jgi:hypothetical protein
MPQLRPLGSGKIKKASFGFIHDLRLVMAKAKKLNFDKFTS